MILKKIYTLALLLFTITTFSSCIKSPSNTKTADNTKQEVKNTATIKKVDAAGFKAEVEGKKVQLVDVRTPREYVQGHIENATNINIYDGSFGSKILKLDKSKPVYVYCLTGVRSRKASNMLKSKGYNVVDLNRGISSWMRNGFKVVK